MEHGGAFGPERAHRTLLQIPKGGRITPRSQRITIIINNILIISYGIINVFRYDLDLRIIYGLAIIIMITDITILENINTTDYKYNHIGAHGA